MIILKVTKNQGFTLCLEENIIEKPQGGVKLTPHPAAAAAVLWLTLTLSKVSQDIVRKLHFFSYSHFFIIFLAIFAENELET